MASFTVPLFINGQEHHPPKTFDVVSPATGKTAHRCSAASVDDAAAAVDAAAGAFTSWKRTTPSRRRDILLGAADIINSRREELTRCLMEETGAARSWADFNIDHATEMLKDTAGRIATLEGSFPAMMDPDSSGIVMREPYGVVLAIAPWNAPFILGVRAFALPIAAGNTVVLKASETAPRCIWAMVSALHEAGLPGGVLNMIVHERSAAASATAALIANPHVKKINFTGSTPVGRVIAKLAGEHLKPVVLELGGKAPAIVWEDADLQLAAEQCALGAFAHSGQICMSTEKILVHKAVKQQFVDRFKAAVEKEFPSSAEALTLISSAAVQRNKQLITNAADRGASIIYGDINAPQVSETRLRPIIVDRVTADMDIYTTESFGPTVSLVEIDSEEQAIRLANDTDFGLSSAVFTQDLGRGLRLARELETGAVHINSKTVHDEAVLPHGGAKASGYGRFNAARGLDEWVRTKNVTFKH
ncbi:aldehyde dehydrogenase family protein [Hirsutella rhossiliensis]|uniref:Aldehyde dehydrogenase family domain-containing protein n=1 Tax=Hirsutella rhossiliensis TaxID=111463 RepID=A0A9P8MUI3_9HYPO|nr:aldehyde dehydrogenase family domain-containing protein [Hirsutella rhossiliensis]KAH0962368.1 aldehyde dehydrogenase family domain-containing protein [Hirsutella rhossiliensis]